MLYGKSHQNFCRKLNTSDKQSKKKLTHIFLPQFINGRRKNSLLRNLISFCISRIVILVSNIVISIEDITCSMQSMNACMRAISENVKLLFKLSDFNLTNVTTEHFR